MRLFLGLTLSEAARDEAFRCAQKLSRLIPGKYVPPENYHLTLAFPGETDESALKRVRNATERATEGMHPFVFSANGVSFFGKADKAILYCDVQESVELIELSSRLRASLRAFEIPFDPNPFTAHITLARKANALGLSDFSFDFSEKTTTSGITLFHSTRVDGVLCYLPIAFTPFR